MKKQKRIPISVVKAFATQVGYDHVIVLAYDSKTNTECVATWGKDEFQCEAAARIGNQVKIAMGWPENLQNDKPARQVKREKIEENYNELKNFLLELYSMVEQGSDLRKYPFIVTKLLAVKEMLKKHK